MTELEKYEKEGYERIARDIRRTLYGNVSQNVDGIAEIDSEGKIHHSVLLVPNRRPLF